jgi:hypothetical protein
MEGLDRATLTARKALASLNRSASKAPVLKNMFASKQNSITAMIPKKPKDNLCWIRLL